VRSFEITPAAEAGGNTYYLFFGTGSQMGLRRMKDAMWKVDPEAGQAFRDSTLVDHPVLFEQEPGLGRLEEMLRQRVRHSVVHDRAGGGVHAARDSLPRQWPSEAAAQSG
jgi:hypothetical protein